jgi:hypothetical protein
MKVIWVRLFYCITIFYADFNTVLVEDFSCAIFQILRPPQYCQCFHKSYCFSVRKKSQPTQTNNMQEIQFCPKKLLFCWVVLRKRWNFLNILHKGICLTYLHFHIWNLFNIFFSGGKPVMPVSAPFARNPKAGSCCHIGWDYLCMRGLQYNQPSDTVSMLVLATRRKRMASSTTSGYIKMVLYNHNSWQCDGYVYFIITF